MLSILWARYFSTDHLILHPLASYFCASNITLLHDPSIPLATYFRADYVTVHPSIPWTSYLRADHLILHRLASYFRVYDIILHPSTLLASYFCAIHPLGELFSCRPYNSPPVHLFGELFLCQLFTFSILISIWRVILSTV